jgi:catechol 2,3-dioxygenase-like lactoylglutathione lyase family enzyme
MLESAQPEPVIPVADLDRAISFYCDKLGLKLLERYDVPAGNPMIRVEAGSGSVAIYKSVGAGQSRHTVASFVVDDIESAVEDLRNRGVTFEEYDMGDIKTQNGIARLGGIAGAWFKDPDGNILGIGSYENRG